MLAGSCLALLCLVSGTQQAGRFLPREVRLYHRLEVVPHAAPLLRAAGTGLLRDCSCRVDSFCVKRSFFCCLVNAPFVTGSAACVVLSTLAEPEALLRDSF